MLNSSHICIFYALIVQFLERIHLHNPAVAKIAFHEFLGILSVAVFRSQFQFENQLKSAEN